MKASFERALSMTLRYEGGYVNHPRDPGGATMKGVTQKVYDRWRDKHGKEPRDVRQITDAELRDIYKLQYWDAVYGDRLPAGLDAAVFDFAVNSGPTRAVQELQRVLGLRTDGAMGAVTLDACAKRDPVDLIEDYCEARLAFVKKLSTFSTFGKGWTRRIRDVKSMCVAMAGDLHGFSGVDGLSGGSVDDELIGAAPADPRAMAVSSTPVAKGAAVTAVGTAGTALTDAADRVSWVSEYSEVLKTLFVVMLVGGIALTIYAQLRSIKHETPE